MFIPDPDFSIPDLTTKNDGGNCLALAAINYKNFMNYFIFEQVYEKN